ncbi:GNAT family N-acetyltransferase [Granulicella cerasi]|uniref:GNAT family N-acetyltransferase n=1 Tax=Granulicella cerasi TaxID=741063 RepID=A0ABW1ZBM1_9BACT|nr:GNAT family N-acetyltransferase [Granulicella cerasi]
MEISRAAWPDFKERESIYHLFCKFFSNTSFICENNDGVIVGFLLGFISQVDPAEAYIHLVAVDASAQRKGIASMLYQQFFQRVDWLGAERIRLIVNPENAASRTFHEQMGFVADIHGPSIMIGDVLAAENYNGPGLHMVTYLREL